MSFDSMLTHTATPQRETTTAGVVGGIKKTWVDICPAVPLRRQDSKTETIRRYASDNIVVTHTILTRWPDGQIGDRFNTDDNLYWLIKGKQERSEIGGIDTFYVYDCQQMKVRKP